MNAMLSESSIDALLRIRDGLTNLIDSLQVESGKLKVESEGRQPSALNAQPAAPEPATTLEEVRAVLVAKARAGKTDQIRPLLERFHAASVSEVDPADYTDLLAMAKEL